MHSLIRTAALELQVTDNQEVVKVAGIMRRLQNWIKTLTDKDYSEELEQIRYDSGAIQGTAADLNKNIENLLKSIRNGDIDEYEVALNSVRDLSADLVSQLNQLNQNAAKSGRVLPEVSQMEEARPVSKPVTPEEAAGVVLPKDEELISKYNEDMWKDKGTHAEIFRANAILIKQKYPDHDVPLSKNIQEPLSAYNWFKQYAPDKIHLKEGNEDGGRQNILKKTADLLSRETRLTTEEAMGVLSEKATADIFFERVKAAILRGQLISYYPAVPDSRKRIKERAIGEMQVSVISDQFVIPVVNVKASLRAGLTEILLSHAIPKLVLGWSNYAAVSSGGVPNEWKKSIMSVDEKKAQRKIEFAKLAGLNPSAARQLSEHFWSSFVEMASRLGAKPEDLAKVINSESGFDPHATNIQNGKIIAKGLNQLIKRTALSLGMTPSEWAGYENIPAEQQLPYVEKYFRNVGKATGVDNWASATQLYVANFAPRYVHKAADPRSVLYSAQDNHLEYLQNKGLDRDGKGQITAGDLSRSVSGKLPDFIQQAIRKAQMNPQMNQHDESQPDLPTTQVGTTAPAPRADADDLINALYAEPEVGLVEGLVRRSYIREIMPCSDILVSVSSLDSNFFDRVSFARCASHLLEQTIDAESSIRCDGDKIEIQCRVPGSTHATASAVLALCECVAEKIRIKKQTKILCLVIPGVISKYAELQGEYV